MVKTSTHRPLTSPSSLYSDSARIHCLQLLLCTHIEEVFSALDISLYRTKKMFYGCCPIHGGDNRQAVNLYPDGETVPGYWKCNTWHCQKTFKSTIIGFIRGVLSKQRYDWSPESPNQKMASFYDAVNWACDFLKVSLTDIKVDYAEIERRKFCSDVKILTQCPNKTESKITRADARSRLEIPSKYFVKRGWSPEVLTHYDVGLCTNKAKAEFYNRVVVPIYDNDNRFMIGMTARSIYDKCSSCSLYHDPKESCPTEYLHNYSKWRNSENLKRDSILYNYWFAKRTIQDTNIAILVEGPGEVWRLEEAGFKMGLAMLGTSLTDEQQILLEMSGAMNLIIVTNNDDAGKRSDIQLKEQLGRTFRLFFTKPTNNDLGATSVDEVKKLIGPLVKRLIDEGC
jgi:5S rRNA maturation endonuclease (ribonuclease M5)